MKELDALTEEEQETLMAYLEEVDDNIDYGIRAVKSGDAYLTGCKTLEEEANQMIDEVTTVVFFHDSFLSTCHYRGKYTNLRITCKAS